MSNSGSNVRICTASLRNYSTQVDELVNLLISAPRSATGSLFLALYLIVFIFPGLIFRPVLAATRFNSSNLLCVCTLEFDNNAICRQQSRDPIT